MNSLMMVYLFRIKVNQINLMKPYHLESAVTQSVPYELEKKAPVDLVDTAKKVKSKENLLRKPAKTHPNQDAEVSETDLEINDIEYVVEVPEQKLNDTSKSKQTPMQHQDLHSG